ncbi:hypothetical protein FB45DRAFT_1035275 [Roridomyces roridus]|uniref:Uncharacterized protein n=1 Tax=Roridomyces roridus TaxID=1738132 RepID=A0AAD7FF18_9AGAR|nr:hypothetical protein FB45DRAFT_1035275 [Roridomyces roridus]
MVHHLPPLQKLYCLIEHVGFGEEGMRHSVKNKCPEARIHLLLRAIAIAWQSESRVDKMQPPDDEGDRATAFPLEKGQNIRRLAVLARGPGGREEYDSDGIIREVVKDSTMFSRDAHRGMHGGVIGRFMDFGIY